MTTSRVLTAVRLALSALVAGALMACAPTRDYAYESDRDYYESAPYYGPHAAYYDYWYYPEAGFYYDPRIRIYIYQEHDHWIRSPRLPPHLHSHRGGHVTVRSPHDRPYEDHLRHRDRYAPERDDRKRYDQRHYDPKRYDPKRYDQKRYDQQFDDRQRYKSDSPGHRDGEARIGAPRQPIPDRHPRDDRRRYDDRRDGNVQDQDRGRDRDHDADRRSSPALQYDRAPAERYLLAPKARRDAAIERAERQADRQQKAPIRLAPATRRDTPPARENRKSDADRRIDERHNNNDVSKKRPPGMDGRDDSDG